MPLARIDLAQGKSADYRKTIGEVVYQAMVETLKAPKDDRFQIITEHAPDALIYDANYLGIARTDGIVIVQITLNAGRTTEQKKALYAAIADNLSADPGVRRQDVFVNLVEVQRENWSFGNGEAQYA